MNSNQCRSELVAEAISVQQSTIPFMLAPALMLSWIDEANAMPRSMPPVIQFIDSIQFRT